jgi:hypothetical protein
MVPGMSASPLREFAGSQYTFKTAAMSDCWPPRFIPEIGTKGCALVPVDHSKERDASRPEDTVGLAYLDINISAGAQPNKRRSTRQRQVRQAQEDSEETGWGA